MTGVSRAPVTCFFQLNFCRMKLIYTLLGLVLLSSAVQADSITTIQLRNRPAAEVIPIVKPMLGADDAISGQGFKIFLRSSAQTLAQVRGMIEVLDVAGKTLQISVFQGSTRGLRALGFGANIQIESGDASVNAGTSEPQDGDGGGSITYSTRDGSGSINSTSTRLRLQDNPIHQVRVTEGNEAYIETGEQIPYFSGTSWITPEGVSGGLDYKKVTTGFYVLPRVNGDRVTLQVSPFKNSNRGGGNIETQSARTTISGKLGEWLLIGGVTEQLKRAQSGTGSYKSTQSRKNEGIWIKADLVQ